MNIWFKPILLSSYIVVTTENMYNNSKLKWIGKQAFAYTNFFPYKSLQLRNSKKSSVYYTQYKH